MPTNRGNILEMTLSIHGTKDPPNVYKNGPRLYDDFKLAKPVSICFKFKISLY